MSLVKILNWLNDDADAGGPVMHRDGRFVMLSWRDMCKNRNQSVLDGRMIALMSVLMIGLPALLMM